MTYLTNKALLDGIRLSKRTWCNPCSDAEYDYAFIASNLALVELPPEGLCVRVMTESHVPILLRKDSRGVSQRRHPLPFPAFSHYRYDGNEWIEVVRSHWQGPIPTGRFNIHHGQVSNRLALLMILLVDRISAKGNWRNYSYLDELKSKALVDLTYGGLKFDESKGNNPFAYLSQIVHNSFTTSLNAEKKQANIKEELMRVLPGYQPTFNVSAQIDVDSRNT
ncbi:MAG: hypothetical protein EOO77_07395 [Oxalobacteraceae bacterium]|nr:MAG: hypothetical protein EOO77_07395 [Oxalobacteraceae bacterium]